MIRILELQSRYQLEYQQKKLTQLQNTAPQDFPKISPSSDPTTSSKHPVWPSRGYPHLISWGLPNLTSQGLSNLTSQGRPKSMPWRRSLVEALRTSLKGPPEDVLKILWVRLLDAPNIHFILHLLRTQCNAQVVFRTQSSIYDGAFFQKWLMDFSRKLFLQNGSIMDVQLGSEYAFDTVLYCYLVCLWVYRGQQNFRRCITQIFYMYWT